MSPTDASRWAVFAVAATSVFMLSLDGMVVPVALPAIDRAHPDVSTASMTWVIGALTITVAALVVAVGRIGDRIGRKRLFLVGGGFFITGSALAGLAPSFWVLVGARAVSGIGAGLLGGSGIGLTLSVFPAHERTKVITAWTAVGAVGGALGPTLGGLLVEGPGWRWVFLINVFIGLPVFLWGRSVLVDTERSDDATLPDMVGAAMSAVLLGSLVFLLVQGRASGWLSTRVVAAFVVAMVLLPILAHRARNHPAPIIQPGLLSMQAYRRALAVALLLPMSMFANFVMVVQFLDSVWDYSGVRAGLAVLPFSVCATVTATLSSRFLTGVDERRLLTGGLIAQAAALLGLAIAAPDDPGYLLSVGPALVVLGIFGWGLAFPMANAFTAKQLDETNYGVGMGVQSMARSVGGLVGVAIVLGQLGEDPDGARFRLMWWVLASITMLAVLMSLRLFAGDVRSGDAVQPSSEPAPSTKT